MVKDYLPWKLRDRELYGKSNETVLKNAAVATHGSAYEHSRACKSHLGCVNAIALSCKDALMLASGGDDGRVLVGATEASVWTWKRLNPHLKDLGCP